MGVPFFYEQKGVVQQIIIVILCVNTLKKHQ